MLGPPGSGKGTQSLRLAERYGVPAISTGDLFRAEVSKGTAFGRVIASLMAFGELVSDSDLFDLLQERLDQPDCQRGFILDGAVRTVLQASVLDYLLGKRGVALDRVVDLRVDEAELIQRILLRGQVSGRSDDTEEVVRNRLIIYNSCTLPVSAYYEARGILSLISGTGTTEEVFHRIVTALECGR